MADMDEDDALEDLLDAILWVVMFVEERGVEMIAVRLLYDTCELIISLG